MGCKGEGKVQNDGRFWLVHLGKRWAKLGRGGFEGGDVVRSLWGSLLWLRRILPVGGVGVPGGGTAQAKAGRRVGKAWRAGGKEMLGRLSSLVLGSCP